MLLKKILWVSNEFPYYSYCDTVINDVTYQVVRQATASPRLNYRTDLLRDDNLELVAGLVGVAVRCLWVCAWVANWNSCECMSQNIQTTDRQHGSRPIVLPVFERV
ncbi:hypothetical protein J6590_063626 [Homalodisca vitripennis]|nr:hypothetical protein J6590_063626 [Homalodisca vitripennis]